MSKAIYSLIALIVLYLFFIAIVIIMMIIAIHCNSPLNACDQSTELAVYIAITVAGTASASAAVIESVFYHRQTKQANRHHDEHMQAIKRLEEKVNKISAEMESHKSRVNDASF